MADTVYVLGAGINRVAGRQDRGFEKPPLTNDFFQLALGGSLLDPVCSTPQDKERYQAVFDYIQRFWRLSEEDLKRTAFDLEECFTMLRLQRWEVEAGSQEYKDLLRIELDLAHLLARYLAMFEEQPLYVPAIENFGELIYQERSSVLTFNYDLILERALELASGDSGVRPPTTLLEPHAEVPEDLLALHQWKWTRALAYGMKFDEVELQHIKKRPGFVQGVHFYRHPENRLYEPPLLKLHGSLNWFRHTSIPSDGSEASGRKNPKEGQTVIVGGYPWMIFGMNSPEVDGWLLEPMIVTPVLHKDLSSELFKEIWYKARNELKSCRRLVIGGYSFPPSDFHTRRLFREAFEKYRLEELIVINPDTSVVETAKSLCYFNKPVAVCASLEEYMEESI